jgi:hypothetical protein
MQTNMCKTNGSVTVSQKSIDGHGMSTAGQSTRSMASDLAADRTRGSGNSEGGEERGTRGSIPAMEALVEVDGVLPGDHLLLPRRSALLVCHPSPPLQLLLPPRRLLLFRRRRERKTLLPTEDGLYMPALGRSHVPRMSWAAI